MMIKNILISVLLVIVLNSCGGKLPGADAKKYPPNPKERVKNNLEQGKGFRLDTALKGGRGGDFEFASSNELWRASLDVIDFMPLTSANYSGGIIITDWYSEQNENESIKITIRFLSNEVRSDALNIKIFHKICDKNFNCVVREKKSSLNIELQKEILKKAAIYAKQTKDKNFRPYNSSMVKTDD
tara:strand:- start:147 stop:701 length:555 start_codon:yes stop_codon:yes gene_type:complete